MRRICIAAITVSLIAVISGCNKINKVELTNVDVSSATINIKAVGDNMFHSTVLKYAKTDDGTYNFDNMYSNIKSYIQSADIACINQESAIVPDKRASGYPAFGVPDSICSTLVNTGFDVILQANNHVADKEESGFESTIEAWKGYPQVTVLGIHDSEEDAGKIHFVEANSIKLGLLNYTYGVNRETWPIAGKEYMIDIIDEAKMQNDITRAKKLSDAVIVFLHDGDEYKFTPSENQKSHINHCIDYGADIVICAHPHVIQPYEAVTTPRGNKGLVFYSLGNFISGQEKFDTMLGGVADITLNMETTSDKKKKITVSSYGLEPIVTHLSKTDKLCTVYKLRDYTDELAATTDYAKKHKDYNVQSLWDLYYKTVNSDSTNNAEKAEKANNSEVSDSIDNTENTSNSDAEEGTDNVR